MTVVTRETEWDDDTRERALRLAAHKDSICGCGCGLPVVEARKKQAFIVDSLVCEAGRALVQVQRKEDEDAKATKRPDGWKDGRHYYVRVHDDDDGQGV